MPTTTIPEEALTELRAGFRGPALRQDDPGYDEARTIYNGMFDRRPGVILRCSGAADVIDAVNFARDNDLVMAVRGGGHSVAGNSVCEGGVMIDLSQMNGVHLDLKAQTVRAGGGATWGALDRETQAFGLVAPGGVVSTTGIAGLTLNGGLGWVRNKYGLSCDNLVSADVVLASGELVRASASENEDLFWALRGGGGNFGVVTSFEFKVHPLGPMVFAAIVIHPLAKAPTLLRSWRDWVETTPDEVSSACIMWTVADSPHMPPPAIGKEVLITASLYTGAPEEGEKVLAPLRGLGEPIIDISGVLPFRVMQSAFDWAFPVDGSVQSYWKSVYAQKLSDELIDIVVDLGQNRSSPQTLINIPYFSGAVTRVGRTDTAFATREPFMVSLDGNWTDASEASRHIDWVRSSWDRLHPHSTGAVYLNFMGQEENPEVIKSAFGENYERLAQIKQRYDPTNLFRLNHNVQPKSA